MKRKSKIHLIDKSFERQVFEALKFYGYKIPKSEKEIEQYVKMFGNTKVELPNSLTDADLIFDNLRKKEPVFNENDEILGMAARGDKGKQLPKHIWKKIKEDIKQGKWLNNDLKDDE